MFREQFVELVSQCDDPDVAVALIEELEPEVERTESEWARRVSESLYSDLTSGSPCRAADAVRAVAVALDAGWLPRQAYESVLARARRHAAYTRSFVEMVRAMGASLPDPAVPF
jgi:hypothetical protein